MLFAAKKVDSKNNVLGGELKCRHILLFLMEYDKEEYCLHRYLLYIWITSFHSSFKYKQDRMPH